jgi:three-Cys-motif partner protein
MKKADKYLWRIGSPPPRLDQHSAVKHRIIESYVRDYISTLMAPAHIPRLQLTLVDGFSGGGAYLDEDGQGLVDGSPALMLRAVREARMSLNLGREKLRDLSVDFEFIDIIPDTTKHLEHWIRGRADEGLIDQTDLARTRVRCGKFLNELPRLIADVKRRKMGERAIFVLDQYAYDQLPMHDIATIMQSMKGSEVILNFNVGSLITFLSDRAANRLPMERVGLDQYIPWERLKYLKLNSQWRQLLQRDIAYGIRQEAGAKFATIFFVRPSRANPWDYWLIHLSNHYKAHEVMKNLHWKNATYFGHELAPGIFTHGYIANDDAAYTQQGGFDFGAQAREECVDGIREHLGGLLFNDANPVCLGDVIQSLATRSPGSTEHFMAAAAQLHRSQDIVIADKNGRVLRPSKGYRMDSVIEANPTPRFLF